MSYHISYLIISYIISYYTISHHIIYFHCDENLFCIL